MTRWSHIKWSFRRWWDSGLTKVAIVSAFLGAATAWAIFCVIPWHPFDVLKHIASFPNCTASRAVGVAPAYRGRPGYWPSHDADNDGIACENLPVRRVRF